MKTALIAIIVALSTASTFGQDFHVTGIEDHIRDKTEESFSTPLHSKRVTGTIGDKVYHLEEAALMAYHFEVGTDYPVEKLTDNRIQLRVTDKKGHEQTERLTIRSVAESVK